MKRRIILLTLIISSLGVNAQSLLPIKYGIKVGVNIANVSSTPNDGIKNIDNTPLIGINGGFYMEIALNDKWYINPEIMYTQKGASFNYNFTHDFSTDFFPNQRVEYSTVNKIVLSYIELNPTFSFKRSDKISLNFGPSFSFLISDAYSGTKELIKSDLDEPDLLDGFFESQSLDIGLNLGISYSITEALVLDTRVYTGLMESGTINQPYPTDYDGSGNQIVPDAEYKVNNQAIVISFIYLF